jgi:Aldo/keto reductase family
VGPMLRDLSVRWTACRWRSNWPPPGCARFPRRRSQRGYAHNPDPDTPLEQTLSAYDDLLRQGKLRYVALSNRPAWQLTHALWIADARRLHARSAPR